jgi:hypothetical protein
MLDIREILAKADGADLGTFGWVRNAERTSGGCLGTQTPRPRAKKDAANQRLETAPRDVRH